MKNTQKIDYTNLRWAAYETVTGLDLRTLRPAGKSFRWVHFVNCDFTGVDFSGSDWFRAKFGNCNLSRARFDAPSMLSGMAFKHCAMRDAVLPERLAEIGGWGIWRCDLRGAVLPAGVPIIENIHQAVYDAASQPGALDQETWHTCSTTHCRAGWTVVLAGIAGTRLEELTDAGTAAALIYYNSDPSLYVVPDWLADETTSLADMKRLARVA